ncbi:hypothetical protein M406DRAFT_284490 [Cryphonectria parasitica EP155]|uniref:Uncharacterized protein n=1 Tax=Cryphonectria parasitica (strain ATCC 38755 / EP155) TaxID=660469 RepID=A0A9P4YAX1_CRYP1|nr:uncharacterized protein M406DRAFT_284490 [Cryphonectria parasitica EP155]KAF3769993.1 hypothetical protein M406DRAFT_284490 [Cryphonectria parasitica EP155]
MGAFDPTDSSTELGGQSALRAEVDREDDADQLRAGSPEPGHEEKDPKAIAQIFQCPVGPHILRDAIKLPCGQCLCKTCLPESYTRAGVEKTWPGTSDRIPGIRCPCCDLEHPRGDCWPDYLSNRALKKVQSLVATLCVSTVKNGKKLVEAFEALHLDSTAPENDADSLIEQEGGKPNGAIDKMESILRREMDCAICHSLLYQPWTTPCGHTFCHHCIIRSLEISPTCPSCRTKLLRQHIDNRLGPPNDFIVRVTKYFWSEDLAQRREHVRNESPYPPDDTGLNTPLFVCTVSFPCMPTLLHVFEYKYRMMMRRVWDDGNGGKHFGMVLPDDHNGTARVGVHLRIEEFTRLPDGRSYVETAGTSRFRIKRRGLHPDGYVIAEVEEFEDVSLWEEENREADEIISAPSLPADFEPTTRDDLNHMTTKELMNFAYVSIRALRQDSPAWLHGRILTVYGQCPDDPALFPWWLGSIIPTTETQKVRLLEQVTVRERMKICCGWILDWNAQRRSSSW